MNAWSLCIAQIQRPNPPPMNVPEQYDDSVTLFACTQCGRKQPEDGFYHRRSWWNGTVKRAATCKVCEKANAKEYRDKYAPPMSERAVPTDMLVLNALAKESMIVSEISEAVGRHRRTVDKALVKLIEDGLVETGGFKIIKYHPRAMKFRLTKTGEGNEQ